jgi:alkanesulfonate monooxygenase SsuD/methylene tetrahydromethanopterin reductase-like flavin-dependent oxidoreductase (luciferase family)
MTSRGIALFAGTAADVVAETAAATEELGYASFWLNHPGSTDGVAGLEVAARATAAIDLGVGVVPIHLRGVESVVDGAREASLPTGRLLIGIGTAGPGAYALARRGTSFLHDELGCRVVMGALGEGACRLAGEIADAVLLNWLTTDHARRSIGWIEAGAAVAGRSRPPVFAYVRVAIGPGARARVEEEGDRYAHGSYGAHFQRMGAAPIETAVPAADAAELRVGLAHWDGVVDQVLLRFLPASGSLEAHLELVRAGAPER